MNLISVSDIKSYFTYDDDFLRRLMFLVFLLMPALLIIGRSPLDIATTVIAVSFLIHSLYWRDFNWVKSRWVQATLIFWVFIVLNSLQALDVEQAISRAGPYIRFPIFAIAISYWIVRKENDLRLFIYAFVATLVFSTADGLFELISGYDFMGNEKMAGRLSGPFQISTLGIYLTKLGIPMMIAFLAVAPLNTKLKQYGTWIFFGLMLVAIVFSGERMALLLMMFSLFLCAWMVKRYRVYLISLLIVIVLAFSTFVIINKDFYNRIYMSTFKELQSDPNKSKAYKGQFDAAIDIIRDNPILGVGSNNYRYVCKLPKYDPLATKTFSRCLIHPHHVYLETWVNNGLVGLLLFAAIIFQWIKIFTLHRPDRTKDYLLLSGSLGVLLFLWPFSVGMSIFSNFNGIWFWMMIGFALAAYQIRTSTPYDKKS